MKPDKYGAIMRGHAFGILEQVFNAEWLVLESADQRKIADDFLDAANGENCSAREYARRIGAGNLASYARCLK